MPTTNPVLDYLSEDMKREYTHYVSAHTVDGHVAHDALTVYIDALKAKQQHNELQLGYEQMAQFNQDYAESGFGSDISSLNAYEMTLSMRAK